MPCCLYVYDYVRYGTVLCASVRLNGIAAWYKFIIQHISHVHSHIRPKCITSNWTTSSSHMNTHTHTMRQSLHSQITRNKSRLIIYIRTTHTYMLHFKPHVYTFFGCRTLVQNNGYFVSLFVVDSQNNLYDTNCVFFFSPLFCRFHCESYKTWAISCFFLLTFFFLFRVNFAFLRLCFGFLIFNLSLGCLLLCLHGVYFKLGKKDNEKALNKTN